MFQVVQSAWQVNITEWDAEAAGAGVGVGGQRQSGDEKSQDLKRQGGKSWANPDPGQHPKPWPKAGCRM